ncbi:MAG: hypothetical protein ACOX0L_07305 [Natronincolaceae bacterium]|jgi:predicted transcriptional regulator
MKKGHSGQKFKFDILLIFKMLDDIQNGINQKETIAIENGLGDNKVGSYIEYLNKVDCINKDMDGSYILTHYGKTVNTIKHSYSFVEPLLLYKLCRGEGNGGHLYFSILVNFILNDIAFKIDNKTTLSDIEDVFQLKFPDIKVVNRLELLRQALNQGLCDTTTGFGKMGMVIQKDGQYEITGYIPHKLITAYILYDNWPEGRAALKMDEIVTMDYFPCKIFFMSQDLFMGQIYELAEDRMLYIEKEAGLNQIRLAPNWNSEKILDRIVEICQ